MPSPGVNMLHASGFLLLGALAGAFLRLPAFMLFVVLTLATYGFVRRYGGFLDLGWELVVALLALQCGYALTILFRLAWSGRGLRRDADGRSGRREQDGTGSGTSAQ